eukprot:785115_1
MWDTVDDYCSPNLSIDPDVKLDPYLGSPVEISMSNGNARTRIWHIGWYRLDFKHKEGSPDLRVMVYFSDQHGNRTDQTFLESSVLMSKISMFFEVKDTNHFIHIGH